MDDPLNSTSGEAADSRPQHHSSAGYGIRVPVREPHPAPAKRSARLRGARATRGAREGGAPAARTARRARRKGGSRGRSARQPARSFARAAAARATRNAGRAARRRRTARGARCVRVPPWTASESTAAGCAASEPSLRPSPRRLTRSSEGWSRSGSRAAPTTAAASE